jgi:hypothetical protein
LRGDREPPLTEESGPKDDVRARTRGTQP